MTAADGGMPVGQRPAPEPTRTLRFQVAGGRAAGVVQAGPAEPADLPGTLGPVQQLLATLPRQQRPAPDPVPPPARRHRSHPPARLPRQRRWYTRPLPAAMAVGGLVTVAATGLAEGLAPGAPAGIPAPHGTSTGTGSTLRGAQLLPEPGPTPAEVPARTVTVAPAPAAATSPAEQTTASDPTVRPKRTRKPRRTRTGTPSGRSATGRAGGSGTPAGTPTGDPTGQVTIGPP